MRNSILVLAAAVVLAAGCGKKEETTTYSTPQGDVTVKQDAGGNGTMTVKGPQGEATVSSKDGNVSSTSTDASGKTSTLNIGTKVDLSQLGVKLYPGATQKEGSSVKTDTPQGTSMAVQLETKDAAEKIISYYKTELKADTTATTGDGGMVSGKNAAGDQAMVMVTKGDGGNNNISVTVVKKK